MAKFAPRKIREGVLREKMIARIGLTLARAGLEELLADKYRYEKSSTGIADCSIGEGI